MASFDATASETDGDGPSINPPNTDRVQALQSYLGHKESVLCLDVYGQFLASASEDSTVRIWDLQNPGSRAIMCLCRCFGDRDVTSVAFSPLYSTDSTLFAAAGGKVYEFNLSAGALLVMHAEIQYDLMGYFNSSHKKNNVQVMLEAQDSDDEDEINQITIHSSGQVLAAALDAGPGAVAVLDLPRARRGGGGGGGPGLLRGGALRLLRRHENLCTAVAFRPPAVRRRGGSGGGGGGGGVTGLVSGGYDQRVYFWDVARGRPAGSSDLAARPPAAPGAVAQVVNPPFVHSLSYSPDGRYLAAGLGDGSVSFFECRGKRQFLRLPDVHGSAVMQVQMLEVACSEEKANNRQPNSLILLLSAGNDQQVHIWDVSSIVCPCASQKESEEQKSQSTGNNGSATTADDQQMVSHQSKINKKLDKKKSKKKKKEGLMSGRTGHHGRTITSAPIPPQKEGEEASQMEDNEKRHDVEAAASSLPDPTPLINRLLTIHLREKPNWVSLQCQDTCLQSRDLSKIVVFPGGDDDCLKKQEHIKATAKTNGGTDTTDQKLTESLQNLELDKDDDRCCGENGDGVNGKSVATQKQQQQQKISIFVADTSKAISVFDITRTINAYIMSLLGNSDDDDDDEGRTPPIIHS